MYTLTVHLHCNEDPESIVRLKAKLVEAARIYRKDKETADWLVMQDVHDPRSFTIVERFENESVCCVSLAPIGQISGLSVFHSSQQTKCILSFVDEKIIS
jgi:hypothetical protein